MRRFAAILLAATMFAGCSRPDPIVTGGVTDIGPSVRIELMDSVGSGVYIGDGVIITAAHVVGDKPAVAIISEDGRSRQGTVMWANKEYDIAAVRVRGGDIGVAALDCRVAPVGEVISTLGNPMGIEFVSIHGYVSSKPREFAPNWKYAFVVDMTTIGGMSGGAAFDAAGDVIGIVVGTASMVDKPYGSLGFVVPAKAVCDLLGRVA